MTSATMIRYTSVTKLPRNPSRLLPSLIPFRAYILQGVGKGQELQSVDLPASRLPSPLNPSIPCAARLTVRPSAHADAGGAAERSMYAYVRYVVKVKRSKRGHVYAAKYGPRAVTEMGVPLLSTFSSRVSAGRWGVRGVGGATERALCRRAPGTLRSVGD